MDRKFRIGDIIKFPVYKKYLYIEQGFVCKITSDSADRFGVEYIEPRSIKYSNSTDIHIGGLYEADLLRDCDIIEHGFGGWLYCWEEYLK